MAHFTIDPEDNLVSCEHLPKTVPMKKHQFDFSHLPSTLTHERLVKDGYVTHLGPDGFQTFLSPEDRKLTTAQIKAMARYGNFPPTHDFHGTRLAPVYWRKAEIATWLYLRSGHSHPELVKAAKKAGYIPEGAAPTSGKFKNRAQRAKAKKASVARRRNPKDSD